MRTRRALRPELVVVLGLLALLVATVSIPAQAAAQPPPAAVTKPVPPPAAPDPLPPPGADPAPTPPPVKGVAADPCPGDQLDLLVKSGKCTHGPDPAPPGRDVDKDVPLASAAQAAAAPAIECIGDG